MDVEMPDMDGLQAAAAIRDLERPSGARTPILAMTAHALQEARDRCLQAGMDGHISKPIRPDSLFEALAAVTANVRPNAPDPASP
jgi:CheY-like chemotaxis protein